MWFDIWHYDGAYKGYYDIELSISGKKELVKKVEIVQIIYQLLDEVVLEGVPEESVIDELIKHNIIKERHVLLYKPDVKCKEV